MAADHDHGAWTGWKARAYALFHRNPAASRGVVDWAQLQPDMQILDIGCGSGAAVIAAAPLLSDGAAFGVDPSPDFVRMAGRRARRLSNVAFEVAAAEQLPFPDQRFDVAWSVHATHHWDDLTKGFIETRRVLRPGGRFLIVERHDGDRSWGITSEQAQELSNTMADNGFVNAAVEERKAGRSQEFLISGEKSADD